MREWILLLCLCAVTTYLVVAALEDHKSCTVTRWKHLIGGVPAILLFIVNFSQRCWEQNAMILAFSVMYIVIGFAGVYGFADGLVFAVLTIFFGSIGGAVGSGAVLLIAIIASFSFLFFHCIENMAKKRKVFQNMAGPFIPYILAGYGILWAVILLYAIK